VDTHLSASVIKALDAFDAAWQQQPTPPLEPYIPPNDHPSRLQILVGVVRIDMERRVKAGSPPCIEDYLERFPELRDDEEQFVKLVLLEYRSRQQLGFEGNPDDVTRRFPQFASRLSALLNQTIPPLPDEHTVMPATRSLDLREYVLLESLGRGGMGEVFLSRDPGLDRPLALKVIKSECHGIAEMERRFEEEARIAGSLQHPGIVPIHNLGRLPDGRLYFTMKVMRGPTLADMLRWGSGPAHLPVFEQVCQAVAYAHSKGVIHRDLKPANIMVGRFGEVQVMDWGLAKVLRQSDDTQRQNAVSGTEVGSLRTLGQGPKTFGALGTWEYMPPEQANGEWDQADERVDVFALGSILCEILTDAPAYRGGSRGEVKRKAERGDLAEAFARLTGCSADGVLVGLAKECMCAEVAGRPRNAGVVAERVAEYQVAARERLRKAEVERAAVQARAEEAAKKAVAERRARKAVLGLAAAVLLLLLAGGGAGWLWRQRQAQQNSAEQKAEGILEPMRESLEEAWNKHDLARLAAAAAEAKRAVDIAHSGGADLAVQERAETFWVQARQRLRQAQKNRDLLNSFLNVAAPRETLLYRKDGSGRMLTLADKSEEDQYAEAFRTWDLDVDRVKVDEAAAQIKDAAGPVLGEVIAGFNSWMLLRWRKGDEAGWQHLFRLADALDRGERSRDLRRLLVQGPLARPEDVAGALGNIPSWPALWAMAQGNRWRSMALLRKQVSSRADPVLIVLLAQVARSMGDLDQAELELRQALAVRPTEVALLHELGKVLTLRRPAKLTEAVGCFRAMRAVSPRLGIALAGALLQSGQAAEAEDVVKNLVSQQPDNPEMHYHLGYILAARKKPVQAQAAYNEAIRLKHDYPEAYVNLGIALIAQNKFARAEAAFQDAIRIKNDLAIGHANLGVALEAQGKLEDAVKAYRTALRLRHDLPKTHWNLGFVLAHQANMQKQAEESYREALRLNPNFPEVFLGLGNLYRVQARLPEAEVAFREAIRLKDDFAFAHCNLGHILLIEGRGAEAIPCYRRALVIDPQLAPAHFGLGEALMRQGEFAEAQETYRRGLALPIPSNYRRAVLGVMQQCQQLLADNDKLTKFLGDKGTSADAAVQAQMASLAQHPYRRLYLTAVQLYLEAFGRQPNLRDSHRYNAACAAALASCGQGKDADKLVDNERARLRKLAFDWLSADLERWSKTLDMASAQTRAAVQRQMRHWQTDGDLASVRDKDALARLPEAERKQWQNLWAEVEVLRKKSSPSN
jgi:eukaryotic-like serine/threonine-protein kinase